ncbi:MAG: ATP-binding cassette domain-containing protein [Myxococcales bacterium]|nr:ATP-binding cassette domain-containing protein [Myxococcales bacterium]
MIDVECLSKQFRVPVRGAGLRQAIRALFKREYTIVEAVSELSFSIAAGEKVGFLGPNGAGKTTTLKMLSGLLHPSSGSVRVAKLEPKARQPEFLRAITLVMGQKQQLIWDLPPIDTFDYNRAVFGVPREEYDSRIALLSELLQLGDLVRKPTRQLSLGERMRCELAAALIHGPSVLFLDEPTIGLDVSMQLAVREFVRDYAHKTGATLLLTSHYMNDVLSLCDRVVVIDQGRLRYDGDLLKLARSLKPVKRLTALFSSAPPTDELERVGRVVTLENDRVALDVPTEEFRQAAAFLLARPEVIDLSIEDPPIDEAMRELFAQSQRSEHAAE